MRISVISVTEKGQLLSARIKELLPAFEVSRFCRFTHTDEGAEAFDKLGETVEKLWYGSDALVFVCACGIAVRSVAPLVRSKLTDPAVIVIDDCGRFVIPVLSGHIGGANALAEKIAEALGAQAVITTATDTGGLFSPDSFAAANGLIVTDFGAAKRIASAVLDGETIGVVSEYETRNVPAGLALGAEGCKFGLYIGRDTSKKPFADTLTLVPKNIVLGIGCKKGAAAEVIAERVNAALDEAGIAPERVCTAASIDLKRGEEGLLGFCRGRGIKAVFFTAEELAAAEGEFSSSEFVRNVTGVDNVCERSAVLLSGGKLVVRRCAGDGVTVAAAEKPVIIDFERKML